MNIQLFQLAHGRSGDKGDMVNIGVIARQSDYYDIICRELTPEVVKRHFGAMVEGEVLRYELPNIGALNFLLHHALGGGGTRSLKLDAQGKTYAAALLRLELELDDHKYPQLRPNSNVI
jgi:hypothetical protein